MPFKSTSSISSYLQVPIDADKETILPWKVEKREDNVKIELLN